LIKEGECRLISKKMPVISRRILFSYKYGGTPLFLKDLL
jgi:hypothetical protein